MATFPETLKTQNDMPDIYLSAVWLLSYRIFTPLILDDAIPDERKLGMQADLSLLWVCDEVWVFGDEITEGMKKEIIFAEKLNIKVKYISEKDLKKTEVI